jgi:serine/threonine-protein kinase SRPK3
MNGSDIKKAAIQKAKQVAHSATNAANGTNGKKRKSTLPCRRVAHT